MGKLNNAVEIIPIDQQQTFSSNNSNNISTPAAAVRNNEIPPPQKMNRISTPYISDPSIIPRVQKYLENVNSTYISINTMADQLQEMYPEYRKRKRSAFRGAVKKAYSIVVKNFSNDNASDSELTDSSDDIEESEHFEENSINDQLMQMYKNNSKQMRTPVDLNDELIDISSDDDEIANNVQANSHSANGPSTSKAPQYKGPALLRPDVEIRPHQAPSPGGAAFADRTRKRKFETTPAVAGLSSKRKKSSAPKESTITFKDIGGMDSILEDVCKLLVHIKHPEVYRQLGISPPRGFLLHGPPGCGKTLLANAIAGELGVPLLKVAAPELVAGVSGESEERIRELFERAVTSAPCVLFIDEVDAITGNRQNAQKTMEHRIVAQLLSCLDDLGQNESGDRVLVIGATNRPDSLDPSLRRAGRFDREVCLGIPNITARLQILKVLTASLKLEPNFDYDQIAKLTPGFVGADLLALTREAAMAAVNRVFTGIQAAKRESIKMSKDIAQKEIESAVETIVTTDASAPAAAAAAAAVVTVAAVETPVDVTETANEKAANKDDEEEDIIIEPGTTKDEENDKVVASNASKDASSNSSDPVVIIDDVVEVVKDDNSPVVVSKVQNGHLAIDENVAKPVPVINVIVDEKPKTVLEELMDWLQDQAPLNSEQLSNLQLKMEDFHKALRCVQPSAKREGFATVPDVTWDDVGSLRDIREELQMAILAPVRHADKFAALGLNQATGVLLCGPPGCGKTLLAKAIANEAGINFISVKGPELLNMYVGESERAVRLCFQRAKNSAPCVIFFDELDALCPKRSEGNEGGASRVVNQMLTEMDGVESRNGVYLMAASNRPDIIDPAVLRPGRLDKILYVGLPSRQDRVDILRALTKNGKKPPLAPDVFIENLGSSDLCEGYTGADLAALVREAATLALKESIAFGVEDKNAMIVTNEHFKGAISKIRPSVTEKDQKHYEKLRKIYSKVEVPIEPQPLGVEEMEYS